MEETEDIQETLGAWDKLAEFFLDDDQSRWKAIRWITAIVGTLGAIDLVFFNVPVDEAVFLMGFALLLMSVLWLAWYTSFSRSRKEKQASFLTRRDVIWQGASLLAFLATMRVQSAEGRTLERKLDEAAKDPTNPTRIAEVKAVIARAKGAGIRMSPSVVGNVGQKFVEAAKTNPDALSAAQSCVEYKSFLMPNPYESDRGRPISSGRYGIDFLRGESEGQLEAYGRLVPFAEAAQLYRMDLGNPNPVDRYDPEFLVLTGAGVRLDNLYVKNVTFINCHLWYDGGPLVMNNVRTSKCNVDVSNNPAGLRLMATMLASTEPLNFVLPEFESPTS